jgi:histidine phosphotransferase ChpT
MTEPALATAIDSTDTASAEPKAVAPADLSSLDLAALIASRVCHDVISPVGAIINGLEVLDDADDAATKDFALDIIRKSAAQASAKLQFCRIAFGAAGSAGSAIDLGDAENVAKGFVNDDRTTLTWSLPRAFLPKNRVKLLLNLILIAGHTIPRGGAVDVSPIGAAPTMGFRLRMAGLSARIPANIPPLVQGDTSGHDINAHAIQPFYTGMLARAAGYDIAFAMDGEAVVITATNNGTVDAPVSDIIG